MLVKKGIVQWRQQNPILNIQSFLIITLRPRHNMRGNQNGKYIRFWNSTFAIPLFDELLTIISLSNSRGYQSPSFGFIRFFVFCFTTTGNWSLFRDGRLRWFSSAWWLPPIYFQQILIVRKIVVIEILENYVCRCSAIPWKSEPHFWFLHRR